MLKRFVASASQTLLDSRKNVDFFIVRSAASATASAEPAEEPAKNKNDKDKDKKVTMKKKPMTARRAAYRSPARDLLFGIHPIEIALAEKRRKFYKLFLKKRPETPSANEKINNIEEWATNLDIPIRYTSGRELGFLTNEAVHQGVIMQVSRLKHADWTEQMEIFGKSDNEGKLLVYVDCIQDPMNMGAVIRSCVFLGADCILIPTEKTCHMSPTVSKASSGALECAPICRVPDPHHLMAFVKKLEWEIIGTDSDCLPYEKYEVTTKNRLLIIGNEGHGINEEFVDFLTSTISVPGVTNRVGSLNVSVTAAILLSHFAKLKRTPQ